MILQHTVAYSVINHNHPWFKHVRANVMTLNNWRKGLQAHQGGWQLKETEVAFTSNHLTIFNKTAKWSSLQGPKLRIYAMYFNWSPTNMKICPECHGRKLLLCPEHFSFKLLTMLVYAEIWVVNFYLNHCTCIPIVMMKGRFKIVQTWWLCERRMSSMRASTQNHNRKRVHHCSWEAMQMTSSSRDITVM
jgi:hypothetical protein